MMRLNAHKVFATASVAAAVLHIMAVLVAGFSTPDYLQSQRAIRVLSTILCKFDKGANWAA
ncbi:MAG: hypothetical protein QMD07_05235, partial [Thermodesulfovibrionales bacterium]|nr:hypothetical protein [Thermodesulfovibrionales bacterium]